MFSMIVLRPFCRGPDGSRCVIAPSTHPISIRCLAARLMQRWRKAIASRIVTARLDGIG